MFRLRFKSFLIYYNVLIGNVGETLTGLWVIAIDTIKFVAYYSLEFVAGVNVGGYVRKICCETFIGNLRRMC